MANLFSVIIFLVYQLSIGAAVFYFINVFKMRTDILALGFYSILSFFLLLFLVVQSLTGRKKKSENSVIFQYTTTLSLMMELIILVLTMGYLYQLENDLLNLFFIFTLLTPIHAIYFFLHSILFSRIIRARNIRVRSVSIFPQLFFFLVVFGLPVGYLSYKIIQQKPISKIDLAVLVISMAVNMLVVMGITVSKALRSRRVASYIRGLSISVPKDFIRVDDPNEFGYIESELAQFNNQLIKEKGNITLLSDYISQNIRGQVAQYGINAEIGEEKIVAVSTIRYSIHNPEMSNDVFLRHLNTMVHICGELSDEYDGYPVFYPNRVQIVFGAPYYYEHQKYNAIECTQKIIADIMKLSFDENFNAHIHTGICSGKVLCGVLDTKGKNYKEYTVLGNAMELSDKIANAAENVNSQMLVAADVYEGLRTKFTADKSFKIKLREGEDVAVYQVKV